jgi:glutamate decarboxylase
VMESLRDLAIHASGRVAAPGPFELVSDGSAIPVFSFRLLDSAPYTVFDVSERLRTQGVGGPDGEQRRFPGPAPPFSDAAG